MSSGLNDFDHTKLEAHVFPDGVVGETVTVSDTSRGLRKVQKTKIWKQERVLGRGGCGEVRLQVCAEDNEKRAVKRLWTSGSDLRKQYDRELKALLEFSKPVYKKAAVFVEFFGWFEDRDCIYLAMEYVPLGDLENNVEPKAGAIKEREVRDITGQILEGLKIMHQEGFAHRDLKPKNVLVCRGSPDWWVKLADFGLSKRRTEDTAYYTQTGTQSYMAPEVCNYVPGIDPRSSEYTNAIDMWALGCIVYRLASGVVPFPVGPSLFRFCENAVWETHFPSSHLILSSHGISFVKGLLSPWPALRKTAQQASAHSWLSINLLDAVDTTVEIQPIDNYAMTASGGYNTNTHAGLRSKRYSPAERNSDVQQSIPVFTPFIPMNNETFLPALPPKAREDHGFIGSPDARLRSRNDYAQPPQLPSQVFEHHTARVPFANTDAAFQNRPVRLGDLSQTQASAAKLSQMLEPQRDVSAGVKFPSAPASFSSDSAGITSSGLTTPTSHVNPCKVAMHSRSQNTVQEKRSRKTKDKPAVSKFNLQPESADSAGSISPLLDLGDRHPELAANVSDDLVKDKESLPAYKSMAYHRIALIEQPGIMTPEERAEMSFIYRSTADRLRRQDDRPETQEAIWQREYEIEMLEGMAEFLLVTPIPTDASNIAAKDPVKQMQRLETYWRK